MRPHVPVLTPNEDLAITKHQKPISGNIDEEIEERKVTSKVYWGVKLKKENATDWQFNVKRVKV